MPKGHEEDDQDYTIEDLSKFANDMFQLNNNLRAFIKNNGYQRILEDMYRDNNEDKD